MTKKCGNTIQISHDLTDRIELINNIVCVWEMAVRATHYFLKEKDIEFFKSLIPEMCMSVETLITVWETDHRIIAFMGIEKEMIDMLFIHPEKCKQGLGRQLVEYAINELHIDQVDVNEQNEQAIGFYKRMGFKTVKRDQQDGSGKSYPILHMEWQG